MRLRRPAFRRDLKACATFSHNHSRDIIKMSHCTGKRMFTESFKYLFVHALLVYQEESAKLERCVPQRISRENDHNFSSTNLTGEGSSSYVEKKFTVTHCVVD